MKNSEIWKAHPEFSWIQVSSLGNVRTRDRWVPYRVKGKLFIKGRILKQQRRNNGYLQVEFSVNGKTLNRSVHRLVAQTFIPNPDNFPDINHKDCNRTKIAIERIIILIILSGVLVHITRSIVKNTEYQTQKH